MKIGIHQHVFTHKISKDNLDVLNMISEIGFSSVDINIRVIDTDTAKQIRKRAQSLNLNIVGGGSIPQDKLLLSDNIQEREEAIRCIKHLIDIVSLLESKYYSGIITAPSGYFTGKAPTERELEFSASGLKEAAIYAKKYGVNLCIEPVNRYESYVINTIDSALELIKNIDEPNVGLLIDTYHMNIEEKTFKEPILKAGKKIFLVHVNENDRGTPGEGHINWDEVFCALKEINYDDFVSIESFAGSQVDISRLVAIWRQLAPSAEHLAKEGFKFISFMLKKHGFKMF